MVDAQAFGEQSVLQGHHVVVAVTRELHPQAVAGLRRLAVADAVGQDHVVLRDVEQLPGTEELVGELRLQELGAASPRAVENQDGVAHHALSVLLGPAEGAVVQRDFRERLAGREPHVPCDPGSVLGRGIGRGGARHRGEPAHRDPDD